MSRKRNKPYSNARVMDLAEALINNGRAIEEGPRRKQWTKHDLKHIQPLTLAQKDMFHDFFAGKHICGYGSAGTGKTYIALYLALNEMLKSQSIDRIIIVRSAVPTRDMGFMPGTLEEKEALYERPYRDMCADLLGRSSSYQDMKDAGVIQFSTTSYVRGLTWDNAVVIVDEAQNLIWHEINSIVTRLGDDARLIIVGDIPQDDLVRRRETTGMERLINVAQVMSVFSVIRFTYHDIVRSKFVKDWIMTCEDVAS